MNCSLKFAAPVAALWMGVVMIAFEPAAAEAGICKPPDYAGVKVRLMDPAPTIKTSNLKGINSKAKAHGLLKRGNMVLGLTQSEVETAMNMRFRGYRQGNVTCLNIERVEVRFGHSQLIVHIPREYARGTCQYNTVLKHEMEHVRVNREGVRKYARILKKELDRAVRKLNPKQVRTVEDGQAAMKRALEKTVRAVSRKFKKETRRQHAVIDKPGGPYDATGACRKW